MAPVPAFLSRNYLKTMVRGFMRNKSFTMLNLAGLALGFAVFMLSMIYVHFETSFENFHTRSERIYRATHRYTPNDGFASHWARVPFEYINNLPADVRGINTLVRFQNHARKYVRVGVNKHRPDHAYVADKEVFSVFDFNLLSGDPATALEQPHSVVLTKAIARKYFGDADPIGQEIFVIGDLDKMETLHHVTGVMEDLPANTHLPVELLISFKEPAERAGWAYTYVLLDEGVDISSIESEMPSFIAKYSSVQDAKTDEIIFQPLNDIHLHSNLARELLPAGSFLYVKIVGVAGLLILVIAVINFMNLNSAMALGRAKEIGMRKIMGASKSNLVGYLLAEAVFSSVVAFVVGAIVLYLFFPFFSGLVKIAFIANPLYFALAMLAIAVISGLASGLYPVVLLTAISPAEVVKTTKALSFAGRDGAFSLKRVMVTLQFCVSIMLLGSAIIAYQQFRFLSEKNLGMTSHQVVALPGLPDNVKSELAAFKAELGSKPGISSVAACMEVPSREIRDAGPVLVEGVNADPAKAPVMDVQIIDPGFASLMGLEFLAGGNILADGNGRVMTAPADVPFPAYLLDQQREYLINETAMRQLGWQSADQAIGQRISWSIGGLVLAYGPIRGVVRDFHQETLRNKVDPVVMVYEPVWLRTFLVKVETTEVSETLGAIRSTWDKLFPLYPIEYHFLDDLYDNLYRGERVQIQLLFLFSGLAIAIAFIGLVGLVAYSLKTRLKELAIRKVLGATLSDLTQLMSREYAAVLLVGAVIAVPISLYGVRLWLAGFAYHVSISPWAYVSTVIAVFALLMTTVSIQTLRTSRANPAQTLREE